MKSTIKIDYERTKRLTPVIKIIIPKSAGHDQVTQVLTPGFNENPDEDVKDKLLRDFLQLPCMAIPNSFFEVKTQFPIQGDLELTTIGPIEEDNLFSRFRWAIIHRMVPTSTVEVLNSGNKKEGSTLPFIGEEQWNKIREFFDWLDKQSYAPTEAN